MNTIGSRLLLSVALTLVCVLPAAAASPLAEMSVGVSQVDWTPTVEHGGMSLNVSGGGVYFRLEFGAGESPRLSVGDASGNVLPDGSYVYELVASPPGPRLERGRDRAIRAAMPVQSGAFRVQGGSFVSPEVAEAAAPQAVAGPKAYPAAEWGNASAGDSSGENPEGGCRPCGDNMTVDGSICVGNDCPTTPSFGFSTILLMENNLRIRFDDTSNSASFPRNDWELTANESSNGGAESFMLTDVTAGRIPFQVRAGAPANSLFVQNNGRVGLKTATPVVELHLRDGDTPTVRLEQDGSSGFTPQTWDLAGNETNFFIRDVTNASRLPFRIRPGALTSSIDIQGDGDVSMGTTSGGTLTSGADAGLYVFRTDGGASILVEEASSTVAQRGLLELKNNGFVRMDMTDTANNNRWQFKVAGVAPLFQINQIAASGDVNELTLDASGNLTITGALTVGPGGCTGCDLVFTEDYPIESIEEHAAYMWAEKHLPGVGPTPEDAPMNLSKKTGGILNELEKAHIYIEQLHEAIGGLRSELGERDALLHELSARLDRIEGATP